MNTVKKAICLLLIFSFFISLTSCNKTSPINTEPEGSDIFSSTAITPSPNPPDTTDTVETADTLDNTPCNTLDTSDTADNQSTPTAEDTVTPTPTPEDTKPIVTHGVYNLSENINMFKLHGRTGFEAGNEDQGLICDSSATGIEFNAYIEGDLIVNIEASAECYFTLFVDGIMQEQRIKISNDSSEYLIMSFNEGGIHRIKLIKQTEAYFALCRIKSVEFTGYFLDTPENNELLIEFIGDSITTGYGNLCENGTEDAGSVIYQDATKSYAYLTAELLSADLSLVCCSGIGIEKSWVKFTMDSYFKAFSYVRNPDDPFIPQRTPDIVVINLGTNDKELEVNTDKFTQKAAEMINLVRQTYGSDVTVVWLGGMMNTSYFEHIENVISNLGGEHSGLYTLLAEQNNQGGNAHPSGSAHLSTAEILADFITANIL